MTQTQRKIATVMVARIVGYSRLVSEKSPSDAAQLRALHEMFAAVVSEFGGREFGSTGETLLAEFPSAINALNAALSLRECLVSARGEDGAADLTLRTGLHLGDFIVDGQALIGNGVDIACSLQELATNGGVVISAAVFDQIEDKVEAGFTFIGEHIVDNVAHPVRVFRVTDAGARRSLTDILSELTRRRVFRSAVAYIVAAWLLVQAGDIVLPVFDAPDWVMRALITLLGVGFPLAMLMTWSVNLSTEGLVRTPDSRFSQHAGRGLKFAVIGSAAAISAVVLWLVWVGFLESVDTAKVTREMELKTQPVIVVAPLTKRVGDSGVDWLGEGISNLLRDALAESPRTVVYSADALRSLQEEIGSDMTLAEAAKRAGVDYLVDGDYISTPSGIVITTRIEDLATGRIMPGDRLEADSIEDAIAGTGRIIQRVRQSLGLPYVDQVGHLAADFAAENFKAYELFVTALEFLAQFDYENASRLLEDTLEIAPDFGIARFRLAQILEATGHNKDAYRMLQEIDVASLSERERLLISGAYHKFTENRDLASAIEIYRELVAKYPFDSEAHQNLAESYWLDFQDEASVRQLERLVEIHPKEATSWMALGERQIDVGAIDGAKKSLAQYVNMRPTDPYPHALLGRLALHEGRFADARISFQTALDKQPSMGYAKLGQAHADYLDGNRDKALQRLRSMITDPQIEPDHRIDAAFDYANILHARGRFRDAHDALLEVDAEILDEGFRESLSLTVRALALAELGEIAAARNLLVVAISKTPTSGHPTRQYFFLALLALRDNGLQEFRSAMETMRGLRIKGNSSNDRVRNAAVDYLQGIAVMETDPAAAEELIHRAIEVPDFHYRLYELGLAEAKAKAGDRAGALAILDDAVKVNPANPRLDLEFDRSLARLLRAELLAQSNDRQSAMEVARQLVAEWSDGAATHPVMQRARALLN